MLLITDLSLGRYSGEGVGVHEHTPSSQFGMWVTMQCNTECWPVILVCDAATAPCESEVWWLTVSGGKGNDRCTTYYSYYLYYVADRQATNSGHLTPKKALQETQKWESLENDYPWPFA